VAVSIHRAPWALDHFDARASLEENLRNLPFVLKGAAAAREETTAVVRMRYHQPLDRQHSQTAMDAKSTMAMNLCWSSE